MAKNEEPTGFKKFVDENKSLLFTIPVFVVLLVIVLFVYVFNGGGSGKQADITPTPVPVATASQSADNQETTEPTPSTIPYDDSTEVVTLPDTEREKDSDEILRNPFALPYRVSGIIFDSKGESVAIIEAENKSFIVKVGDIADEYVTVIKIEKHAVIIEVEEHELTLTLLSD
jgi:Tfp pilus assembly protein PilP